MQLPTSEYNTRHPGASQRGADVSVRYIVTITLSVRYLNLSDPIFENLQHYSCCSKSDGRKRACHADDGDARTRKPGRIRDDAPCMVLTGIY